MEPAAIIRPAVLADVDAIARLHVASWQETYRGLIDDAVLDDPTFIDRRRRFWSTVLDNGPASGALALADRAGDIVGVALAGPPRDEDATWDTELYVLYTYARVYGSGIGGALLTAVVPRERSAALWVAEPNPRAQAFYRKHGFEPDGVSKFDGIREIRMLRPR